MGTLLGQRVINLWRVETRRLELCYVARAPIRDTLRIVVWWMAREVGRTGPRLALRAGGTRAITAKVGGGGYVRSSGSSGPCGAYQSDLRGVDAGE